MRSGGDGGAVKGATYARCEALAQQYYRMCQNKTTRGTKACIRDAKAAYVLCCHNLLDKPGDRSGPRRKDLDSDLSGPTPKEVAHLKSVALSTDGLYSVEDRVVALEKLSTSGKVKTFAQVVKRITHRPSKRRGGESIHLRRFAAYLLHYRIQRTTNRSDRRILLGCRAKIIRNRKIALSVRRAAIGKSPTRSSPKRSGGRRSRPPISGARRQRGTAPQPREYH